jgi:predicted AAA+ superfamily ATPase
MIKNHKKVLIFAPRRSGKTLYIAKNVFKENNFYFTLTARGKIFLEEMMLNRNHVSQHKSIKSNINIDYREYLNTDTVFLDDALYMKDSFIKRILNYDMNFICISEYVPDYNYDLFVKNGFTFLYAPCDDLSKN